MRGGVGRSARGLRPRNLRGEASEGVAETPSDETLQMGLPRQPHTRSMILFPKIP
jgi:hypothetical protein